MSDSAKAEIRTDILTGRKVIVAEQRRHRPVRTQSPNVEYDTGDDPFLQGRESDTPDERLALRKDGSCANEPGWLIRVVPNRYPAVSEPIAADTSHAFAQTQHATLQFADYATGFHDVVVECPDFRSRLVELSVIEFARVLYAWQTRIKQINDSCHDDRWPVINIFRNEGARAGASLPHCHSQILALYDPPVLSLQHGEQIDIAAGTTSNRVGEGLSSDDGDTAALQQHWLNSEISAGQRIVHQTDDFVVVCPFAGRVSWQTRFCPATEVQIGFTDLSNERLSELANMILSTVIALESTLGQFDHNLTLTLPRHDGASPFWMLDLLPRTSGIAGFEMMTDVDVVTVAPESAARSLRKLINWQRDDRQSERICPDGYSWR